MHRHLFLLASFLLPSMTFAFSMSPMVISFSPNGPKASQVLTLDNPTNEKVPITLEAFTRANNDKGQEIRTKTTDFNIYPEQLVLLPNEKRNVRVTFAGEIKGEAEKSYRLIATQLPVDFKQKNAKAAKPGVNLKFLLQYVASAYVTPDGAAAKIKTHELKALPGKKLSLVLTNEGTAHKVLHPASLKIQNGESTLLQLEAKDLKDLEGTNLLPKDSKQITLSLPKDIEGKDLKALLELKESED